ncbi:MAG: phosphate/phosphite/phosphonate ABC transporter substrate-binding protein [Anaerolineae bacterium]
MRRDSLLAWLICVLVIPSLASCATASAAPLPTVRLHETSPLPTVEHTVTPLRMAVAAIISPQGTVTSYQPLQELLAQRFGRPVELVQRRTYAETNELIRRGEVDLAFVCTRAYVVGHREFGMTLLAAPEVNGERSYHSAIIVRAENPAQTVDDLRGGVFAFTDPLSTSGYLYPVVYLKEIGETPESFFRRTMFTYSHDRAIYAVFEGVADAAAVDSLVLDYAMERDPRLRDGLRVLHLSPPFGMPPVVIGPGVRPQTAALLKEFLLTLQDSPEGRIALESLGVDHFVPVQDEEYDSVRALEEKLERDP